MTVPVCYLICGFLGAGKTTYSKKLSDETGAIHLNPDEWCMKLFVKEEYEKNWGKCFSETIDYIWKKPLNMPKMENLLFLTWDFGQRLVEMKLSKKQLN